jgi:hypothetical protein
VQLSHNVPAKDVALVNIVKQITVPLMAWAWAKFDDLSGQQAWQHIFDFGIGPQLDNILCRQLVGTRDFFFEVWQGGSSQRVITLNTIEPGKLKLW